MAERRKKSATAQGGDEATAWLAAIVNSSDDAIIGKTLEGVVTSWNPAAERMFGYSAAEAIGKSITLLIPPDRLGEEDEVLGRLRRGEAVDHYDTVRRRKDGRLIDVSLTVSPIKDGLGRVVGASKIVRDITERRRIEEEHGLLLAREQEARSEAEKANRVKEEFLATLSHELRTPLNAMLGWTRMLLERRLDEQATHRALETIDRNIQLLTRLVEDVLEMSRITMGGMRLDVRPMALIPVVEAAVESIRPAAQGKVIDIGMFLDASVGPVSGDPSRLQQVVWNLMSNAVKFTPREGRVEVHLTQVGSQAEIRVVDSGRGIQPEFLPKVFDRFTQADSSRTRSHGGLGLGLAIVRQLVELHGGTATASSEGEGRGATFTVRLPLLAVQTLTRVELRGSRSRAGMLRGLRVLIVDDDPDAREVLLMVLRDAGATASAAASVGEALDLLERDRPAVILCDLAMPDEDGYDMLRAVRRRPGRQAGIVVAALTAHAREDDRREALAAGFDAHIAKPIDPVRLIDELVRLAGTR